jgi:hypothetical protein
MAMPKATMDENDGAPLRQHHIRPARKSSIMQAEPESQAMGCLSYQDFRCGIPSANAGHYE